MEEKIKIIEWEWNKNGFQGKCERKYNYHDWDSPGHLFSSSTKCPSAFVKMTSIYTTHIAYPSCLQEPLNEEKYTKNNHGYTK